MLVKGVVRERSGGISGRRKNIWLLDYRYDIWGMTPAGTLGMISVNRSVFESSNGSLHKTRLVQGIGVDQTLHIILFANTETGLDACGRRSPVFVQFETTDASLDLIHEAMWAAVIAFSSDTPVDGQVVASLEYLFDVICARRTCCGISASARRCQS